uniref:Uncharacterized protein n=1 Tax=Brassica campestris TaxID=3711 RepID=A0A3P5Z8N3_BRACM|nr:unnamed protein product [Brassica rapa]
MLSKDATSDKKLYLLIFGKPFGATSDKTVWHFFQKKINLQCADLL